MLTISKFTCENLQNGCVTDQTNPRFSYTLESSHHNTIVKTATLSVNGWSVITREQIGILYAGGKLKAFTTYQARLTVTDSFDECATKELTFETGRLGEAWKAEWISDKAYRFREKKVSPKPMTFRKNLSIDKKVIRAKVYATAIGIYELTINGKKVGTQYFAPGFTSYRSVLPYQCYDVLDLLQENNTILAVVGGGWAVGSFVFTRKNRITADRQAFLMELRLEYDDGSVEVIGTDESFEVTEDGNYREADFYDGEMFDATIDLNQILWRRATRETLKIHPEILADYGAPVKAQEIMMPISCQTIDGKLIYDFGQNFAGVVQLTIEGQQGQKITVKHAEILNPDGSLNTAFLRTAKAAITYVCKEGEQTYSPKLTYMGFRYISVEGIQESKIQVSAHALYSDVEQIGAFTCSNEMINRLQENIVWSSKSNFVDIPTDCPQRDERMGWTGDLAVFSQTACFNFDMSRFLEKWLRDLRAEQLPTGGIPNTIPSQGYGFPATMPTMAVDFWGDACVLVPWAEYRARGDIQLLKQCYPTMKKYVKACKFWAGLIGFGQMRYIWNTPSVLHFGDWIAPDVPNMSQWQKRSKWTATASLCNTSGIVAQIAKILGKSEDEKKYKQLSAHVANAYRDVFTDGVGKLKEEFQTAYVLPLYFGMFEGEEKERAAHNLAELVKRSNYGIGTGFPGTPYILFALADNGYEEVAYRMLLNQTCPSWLYEVKMGATTIWERWDGLNEEGICPIGEDGTDLMISYNHYASGAVGDFFYRRIAGIELLEAGYKRFRVAPLLGGDLTFAKAHSMTPYGRVSSEWNIKEGVFSIEIEVPIGTTCELTLPDGSFEEFLSGKHIRELRLEVVGMKRE